MARPIDRIAALLMEHLPDGEKERRAMGRRRLGSLIWRDSGWRARIPVIIDGKRCKPIVDLGTTVEAAARRRLATLLELPEAELVERLRQEQEKPAPLTVAEAVTVAHARWKAEGIKEADQRLSRLKRF